MSITLSPAPATIDAAVATLRTRGLRASSARRLVLAALFAADRPVTAEQIAGGLDGRVPLSDLGSVYRNLETLEGLGVVRHLHAGHGPGLYALAHGRDLEYLVCARCGRVRAVEHGELDRVRKSIAADFGFQASFSHFPIHGVCESCAAAEEGG